VYLSVSNTNKWRSRVYKCMQDGKLGRPYNALSAKMTEQVE